jgi:hypothetical protein
VTSFRTKQRDDPLIRIVGDVVDGYGQPFRNRNKGRVVDKPPQILPVSVCYQVVAKCRLMMQRFAIFPVGWTKF